MEGKEKQIDQFKFGELNVGDTFEIGDKPVLIGGRASRLSGYDVYQVKGLEENSAVSRFGVQIQNKDNQIIVSRPKLNLGGEAYLATNKITVLDTRKEKNDVESEYNAGHGNSIFRIFAGDEKIQNGFILEMVGNRDLRLNAIINNGKEIKWEIN